MSRILLVGVLLGACGGSEDRSSGVEGSKLVVELTSDELDTVCSYLVEINGPERTFTCDGVSVKAGLTLERCISNAPTAMDHPSCTLTVEQLEVCYELSAQYKDDPCDLPASTACNPLAAAACN